MEKWISKQQEARDRYSPNADVQIYYILPIVRKTEPIDTLIYSLQLYKIDYNAIGLYYKNTTDFIDFLYSKNVSLCDLGFYKNICIFYKGEMIPFYDPYSIDEMDIYKKLGIPNIKEFIAEEDQIKSAMHGGINLIPLKDYQLRDLGIKISLFQRLKGFLKGEK